MKVNAEQLEKNLVKLDIELEAEIAAQEYNKACRKISENVSIPGFRKGKAPRNIVEKHVGVERVQREALNALLPNIFADVISEHQYEIIAEPQVESYEYELGKPLKVSAVVELKPEVKLGKYKSLEVEVEEFKHPEDVMEKELKNIQDRFATLETVVDRATTNSDIIMMDFSGTVDGEAIKGGSAKNYQLDLGNSTFIAGFAEQLVGKNIGEEFTIDVTFPENYHDAALQGKLAQFKVKINEIKEKKTPELNDELAAKIGAFKSVNELKTDISTYLEKSAKLENEQRAQKIILEKIVESAEVEIPDSMINKEAKLLMTDLQNKVKMQGQNWDQVLEAKGPETLWAELRSEAQKRVKNSLVLGEIAEKESILVTEEDFENKVQELSKLYATDEKEIYNQMAKNIGMANALTQQLLGQNITKFLTSNNQIKYVSK